MTPVGRQRQRRSARIVAAAALVLSVAAGAFAAEKGYLGLAVSISVEGFSRNPVLKSVSVSEVVPGSPADAAGVAKGDQIIEVEGHAVAGARADDLKPHLNKGAGETLHFKVRRASGETVPIALLVGSKPR